MQNRKASADIAVIMVTAASRTRRQAHPLVGIPAQQQGASSPAAARSPGRAPAEAGVMAAPAIRAMDTVTVAATAAAMAEVEGTAVEAAAGIVSRGAAADASGCRLQARFGRG